MASTRNSFFLGEGIFIEYSKRVSALADARNIRAATRSRVVNRNKFSRGIGESCYWRLGSVSGGGWITIKSFVPAARCTFFPDDKSTVPSEPADNGVYTLRSEPPRAPWLSGVSMPFLFTTPCAGGAPEGELSRGCRS